MNILLVHNEYGKVSGEEIVVRSLRQLLEFNGHHVSAFFRSSAEIENDTLGKAKAFFTGVYNPAARRAFRDVLKLERPDIVHIHNLFPLISPSILGECRRAGIPVVMTVHNYRLVCPNGLHTVRGQLCERCVGGREYHCVLNRCEGSLLKSAGYALRNAAARKFRLFHDNVTMYAALTEFQRGRLIDAGFPADRIAVIPNMISSSDAHDEPPLGDWIGYVGRISQEKGMHTLLAAAAALPDVPFRIAGTCDRMPELPGLATPNVQFVGHLAGAELEAFYRRSRVIVLCSTWFEGFPMVLAEAMIHRKPLICSRIGGLPEFVEEGTTGLLFQPRNSQELAQHIRRLWTHPDLCRRMGAAGFQKASTRYSPDACFEQLMAVYHRACKLVRGGMTILPHEASSEGTRALAEP
jgi:glycosyltransferase involved in cell wall biosynthesis